MSTEARVAYVHVPFCRRRCGYCNFTVVAGRDDLIEAYLEALERELSALGQPRQVETLFIGGGTPTQLNPSELRRLIEIVVRWFPLAAGGEFSVEANPADVDADRIAVLGEFGVNRLSLGAQSFNDAKLVMLERDHRAEHVAESFALAKAAMRSVSLDLIFAAPAETLSDWRRDLRTAVALGPDHISTYGLTFERGTTFWNRLNKRQLQEADEELQRAMYAAAIDDLAKAGFEHYEVSNFAQPRHRCQHNERYWAGDNYYAAGPGAARHFDGRRETNHRSVTTWLRRVLSGQSPTAEVETLSDEDRAREALVLGLRRMSGVDRGGFLARTGYDVESLAGDEIDRYVAWGLLSDDGQRISLTREGLFVSDSMWGALLRA